MPAKIYPYQHKTVKTKRCGEGNICKVVTLIIIDMYIEQTQNQKQTMCDQEYEL